MHIQAKPGTHKRHIKAQIARHKTRHSAKAALPGITRLIQVESQANIISHNGIDRHTNHSELCTIFLAIIALPYLTYFLPCWVFLAGYLTPWIILCVPNCEIWCTRHKPGIRYDTQYFSWLCLAICLAVYVPL